MPLTRTRRLATLPLAALAVTLPAGCTVTGSATAEHIGTTASAEPAATITAQPGLVAPRPTPRPSATAPATPSVTRTSTPQPVADPPSPPPPPPADSPGAEHICAEIQASHMAPDQYRAYIQGQPSFAWMTPQDKADLAGGIRMAKSGSCG